MVDFNERLAALRAKFADSLEFHDPKFRKVGEKIFSGGTRLRRIPASQPLPACH